MGGSLFARLQAMFKTFLTALRGIFSLITNMANQSDAGKDNGMATKQELTQEGVDLFAKAELGVNDAISALYDMREFFGRVYQGGYISPDEAAELQTNCVKLAGKLGEALSETIVMHQQATQIAKANEADINTPYQFLPERMSTRGGTR